MVRKQIDNELFETQVYALLELGVPAAIGIPEHRFLKSFIEPLRKKIAPSVVHENCILPLLLVIPETLLSLYYQMSYVVILGNDGRVHHTLESGTFHSFDNEVLRIPRRPYVLKNIVQFNHLPGALGNIRRGGMRMMLAQEVVALLRVCPELIHERTVVYAGASRVFAWGSPGHMVHVRRDGETALLSGDAITYTQEVTCYCTCDIHVIF